MLPALLALAFAADAKPTVLDVWPGKPPGVIAATGEEKDITKPGEGLVAGRRVIRLGQVSKPTLTVYKPPKEKDTGACVIVCPGGAYHILASDLEGTEVCDWLNRLGITGVLLKYRVPRPKDGAYYLPALMDAQRAVSTVRGKAAEWNIDPKKIGILGFSAGGHLAAATSTNYDKRAYDAIDKIDEVSCRPDFALLIYPGYLVDKSRTKLSDEIRVTKQTPPTFFAHTHDDPVPSESSALMYLALKKAGVPADIHIWESGGHGYGLRETDKPVTRWPARAEDWLRQRGVLPKARTNEPRTK
ncbi:MAG: alpha/beta hydrolase [Gemmataceae bacterium]